MPSPTKLPTYFIPHGGGPCFFMDWTMGPKDTWDRMAAWLRQFPSELPEKPKAILVISGHWESEALSLTASPQPSLLYDYGGFPPHTYQLTWPAPGDLGLVARVQSLLEAAGLPVVQDAKRGFDHGVFIPLKVAFPEAEIPTVQLSLRRDLDPEFHLRLGALLAPLREEGVLIVGSGMSYHNMRGFMNPASLPISQAFGGWLADTVATQADARWAALRAWEQAPGARASHPESEHLLPLMVAAGAAGHDPGREVFRDQVMGVEVGAYRFG